MQGEGVGWEYLIRSIWQFLGCKYSHHGQVQATSVMLLTADVHDHPS